MISISTRIEEEKLKKIEELAKKMNLPRSALIRKFILDGFDEAILKENITLVHEGILSIEQAATQANVSIYRLIEQARIMNIEIGLDNSTLIAELDSLHRTIKNS